MPKPSVSVEYNPRPDEEAPPVYTEFAGSVPNTHQNASIVAGPVPNLQENTPPYSIPGRTNMAGIPNECTSEFSRYVPLLNPVDDVAFTVDGLENILTHDVKLLDSADKLWNYFMHCAQYKPKLFVRIFGEHLESRSYVAGNSRTVRTNRNVIDFDFTIDLTPFISNTWNRIASLENGTKPKSHSEMLNDFSMSTSSTKEILMKKHIGSNLEAIRAVISRCVKEIYLRDSFKITFVAKNNLVNQIFVTVRPWEAWASKLNPLAIFNRPDKPDEIFCEYLLNLNADEIYTRFFWLIQLNIRRHTQGELLLAE